MYLQKLKIGLYIKYCYFRVYKTKINSIGSVIGFFMSVFILKCCVNMLFLEKNMPLDRWHFIGE